ncbi:MAG: hypothetical protein ACI4IF_02105 [Acutalibacteraceae bacterium]
MLDSIWQLLANYGLDVNEIAEAMGSLISVSVDPETGEEIYGGNLAAIIDFPVVGVILKMFASLAPNVSETIG